MKLQLKNFFPVYILAIELYVTTNLTAVVMAMQMDRAAPYATAGCSLPVSVGFLITETNW